MKHMTQICKKLIASVMAVALLFTVTPVIKAEAKGETWTTSGDCWHYLEGTDIAVYYSGEVMKITGSGALPDYDQWTMSERPWSGAASNIKYLLIDSTITSLGSYCFANMTSLKYISMYATTFIKDTTVFMNNAYMPIFRVYGSDVSTEMFGTIPYTSLDSIGAFAQSGSMGASYILDNETLASEFRNSTNPTIANVFSATDSDAPWSNVEKYGDSSKFTQICTVASGYEEAGYVVTGGRRYQGRACYEAFGAFIGDYTFAATFQITAEKCGEVVTASSSEKEYVLTIPTEFRSTGRSFRLLAIGSGTVYIYDDLDTSDSTITFATLYPSTAYALVYK